MSRLREILITVIAAAGVAIIILISYLTRPL